MAYTFTPTPAAELKRGMEIFDESKFSMVGYNGLEHPAGSTLLVISAREREPMYGSNTPRMECSMGTYDGAQTRRTYDLDTMVTVVTRH